MLPASNRLRDSDEFGAVVRRGTRAGRLTLVAHVLPLTSGLCATKVGFVVSKAVGNSVQRNLVKRRLRGAMWNSLRIDERRKGHACLGGSTLVVVRALPPAATASFAELQRDLNSALKSATLKAQRQQ